ncbi:sulfatase-like hydrolase/transferase [Vibrio sp. CAIM 722]|uniref:Sulfatase-like hydrolase/transferase n=1 Tax=Vibrio eleionomae TaxID=2653505 RepID=A0A7X4LKH2_9VIBR|nr:LTA synthase family protein [Vibrio eleionomae]MZI93645.1 sulfatase-like hydrolase/transferase [Vibrio eleionomae]
MKRLRSLFGPLFPVVGTAVVLLCIFSISRIALGLWQFERVSQADGWLRLLISGFRVDIASVCYLLIVPALVSALLLSDRGIGFVVKCLLRVWITVGLWLAVYMEVATPAFITEYDLRPNRLFIEYLIYPKEVFSMLWVGYKLELFIGTVVTIAVVWGGWKLSGYLTRNLVYPKWYVRPLVAVVAVALGVMGARSSFEHRPLNPAMVSFAVDPLVNDLVLNSSYSVLFAAKQMESEASAFDYYPSMPKQAIIDEVRSNMNVANSDFVSDKQPSLAKHVASYQGKPKNIVILLLESHGAQFVKSLGGEDLSPNMDKLIHEGWAFTRMYASGTRSVRGIEAVTTGFSPTPARSVVKLGKSQTNFFTIADLLKGRGYHTQFIYGGESHFDNMKSFFLGNGFVDMQDQPTFSNPVFVGSWGTSDEDLYNKANQQFTQLNQQGKPFFSLVFSSSNHSPFEFPEGRIKHVNEPRATRENAVKYSDYALGEFIRQAKASPYWNDTVFVAVADHDARTFGDQPIPVGHFHIPAVIFGGGIAPKLDNRLVSQIDIAPTLLSLAGISSVNPMIGYDLTKPVPENEQRAMMQRDKNFGWLTADNQLVVLQPGQGISTYRYNPATDKMVGAPVDEAVTLRAHANAMWGSLAFRENYYQTQPK